MRSYLLKMGRRTRQILSFLTVLVFLSSMISSPSAVQSQMLPQPGTKITLSAAYSPLLIKGVTINPEDPMTFDFIIDIGDSELEGEALEAETQKLVKYFLAALTVPDDQLWVNLSPYERDLMVPDALGITEMGKEMLAQDYILKQILASLTDPQDTIGKQFWQKVYAKANGMFGTTDIPVNMFNKVWVVPEKAYILEQADRAFVAEGKLKVMLEEDFLALKKNLNNPDIGTNIEQKKVEDINNISLSVIQEVIIPELEREVNEGKNFAAIRQVYHSVVLATWFKENLKESILGKLYVDKNKVAGVDVDDKSVRLKIYDQYMAALRQGVYDMIKEDYDPASQMVLKRRYFSGGFNLDTKAAMQRATTVAKLPQPIQAQARATAKAVGSGSKRYRIARVNVRPRAGVAVGRDMLQAGLNVANLADHVTISALKPRLSAADFAKVDGEQGELATLKRALEREPQLREDPSALLGRMEKIAPIITRELRSGADFTKTLADTMPDRPTISSSAETQRVQVARILLTTPSLVLDATIADAEAREEIPQLSPAQRATIQTGARRLKAAADKLDPVQRSNFLQDPMQSRSMLSRDEAMILDNVIETVQSVSGLDERMVNVGRIAAPASVDPVEVDRTLARVTLLTSSKSVIQAVARQSGVRLTPAFEQQIDRLQALPAAERRAAMADPSRVEALVSEHARDIDRMVDSREGFRTNLAQMSPDREQIKASAQRYHQARLALATSDQVALDAIAEQELPDTMQRGKWNEGILTLSARLSAVPAAQREQLPASPAQVRALIADTQLNEVLAQNPRLERRLADLAPQSLVENTQEIDRFHMQRVAATAPIQELRDVLESAPMTATARQNVADQLSQLQDLVTEEPELLRTPDRLDTRIQREMPQLHQALEFDPFRRAVLDQVAPASIPQVAQARVQEPLEIQALRTALTTSTSVSQAHINRAQSQGEINLSGTESQSFPRAVDRAQNAFAKLSPDVQRQILHDPAAFWDAAGVEANDLRTFVQRPDVQTSLAQLGQQRFQPDRGEIEQAQADMALLTRVQPMMETRLREFRQQNADLPDDQMRVLDQGISQFATMKTELAWLEPAVRAQVLSDPQEARRFMNRHAPDLARAVNEIPQLRSQLAPLGPSEARTTQDLARRQIPQMEQIHRAVATLDSSVLLNAFGDSVDRDALSQDIHDVQAVVRRDPTLLARPNDLAETIQIAGQRALYRTLQRPEDVQRMASALPDRVGSSDAARDALRFSALQSMRPDRFRQLLTNAASQAIVRNDSDFARALGVRDLTDTREVATRVQALSQEFSELQTSGSLQNAAALRQGSEQIAILIDNPTMSRQLAEVGGIDLSSKMIDLQIKRDGKGFILPVQLQNLENVQIDGLAPVLLNIAPATIKDVPLIMGANANSQEKALPQGLSQVR